jgi:hypothetical protein
MINVIGAVLFPVLVATVQNHGVTMRRMAANWPVVRGRNPYIPRNMGDNRAVIQTTTPGNVSIRRHNHGYTSGPVPVSAVMGHGWGAEYDGEHAGKEGFVCCVHGFTSF